MAGGLGYTVRYPLGLQSTTTMNQLHPLAHPFGTYQSYLISAETFNQSLKKINFFLRKLGRGLVFLWVVARGIRVPWYVPLGYPTQAANLFGAYKIFLVSPETFIRGFQKTKFFVGGSQGY